jgi:hypothetical protein
MLVERRDKDLVRLREQRDQQMAELNERKQKDAVKLASLEELKTLADSRLVSTMHSFLCPSAMLKPGTGAYIRASVRSDSPEVATGRKCR